MRGPDPEHPEKRTAQPRTFRFVLGKGQVEAFKVDAVAMDCYCRWTLRLGYLVADKRHTYELSDHGSPFVTSSDKRASLAFYRAGRWGRDPFP